VEIERCATHLHALSIIFPKSLPPHIAEKEEEENGKQDDELEDDDSVEKDVGEEKSEEGRKELERVPRLVSLLRSVRAWSAKENHRRTTDFNYMHCVAQSITLYDVVEDCVFNEQRFTQKARCSWDLKVNEVILSHTHSPGIKFILCGVVILLPRASLHSIQKPP